MGVRFRLSNRMGGFFSQMTAEEPKPAPQQKQVTQTGNNYGTPQKKIELNDPRSPTQHLDRTPVVVKEDKKVINDPRSPMTELNRTPIAVTSKEDDLRRKVLKSQCLDDENISKRIMFD